MVCDVGGSIINYIPIHIHRFGGNIISSAFNENLQRLVNSQDELSQNNSKSNQFLKV